MSDRIKDRSFKMDKVDRVVQVIFTILTFAGLIAVVFIGLDTFVNVISRYVFRKAINGTVQLAQITLSLVALCSLPIVTMYNTHIKVDSVVEKFPPKIQTICNFGNLILCSAMMIALTYYTFIKTFKVKAMGLSMDVPPIPHWPVYLLIAIMMGVSAICAIYNIVHYAVDGTVVTVNTFDEAKKRLAERKEKKSK